MSNHNYTTFSAWDEQAKQFDVFARFRDNQESGSPAIVLMPQLTQNMAQQIIAIMLREGLLAEHTENGETLYSLTEKGEQMALEAKRRILEGDTRG